MTTEPVRYDLAEIEAQARQLRADMMASALKRGLAWLRKPRTTAAPAHGRTA